MLIKLYKNDLWFRIPPKVKVSPDFQDVYFCKKGEFSPESDIAFNRHINRLIGFTNNPYYQKMNGNRIKAIRADEPFWY